MVNLSLAWIDLMLHCEHILHDNTIIVQRALLSHSPTSDRPLRHLLSGFRLLLELVEPKPISRPCVEFVVMRKFTLFRHLVICRVSRVDLLAVFR
jgi:hypothetical protein